MPAGGDIPVPTGSSTGDAGSTVSLRATFGTPPALA